MTRRHMAGLLTTNRFRAAVLAVVLTTVLSFSLVAEAFTGSGGFSTDRSSIQSQDATAEPSPPEGTAPTEAAEPIATPTEAPGGTASGTNEINVDEPTSGIAAQGLLFWEGGEAVWRVREITVAADATSESNVYFGFFLQREGVSIARNDVTNKRARLEAGEAYYFSSTDPYTFSALGEADSVAWLIELTPPGAAIDDEKGGEVAFESDPIELGEGTYDAELNRNVLQPEGSGLIFAGNGPTLVLGTTGAATADPGDGTTVDLTPGAGVTVTGEATVTNGGAEPAVYLTAALRDELVDAAPAADEPAADPAGTPDAGLVNVPDGTPAADDGEAVTPSAGVPTVEGDDGTDTEGDGLTDAQEAEVGSDPAVIDTDADGIDDFTELAEFGTDPTSADSDGDGVLDGDEVYIYGTDPLDPDTDDDGASDAVEIDGGTDPFDPSSLP